MPHEQDNPGDKSRRKFLKTGIAESMAAVSLPAFSFAQTTMDTITPHVTPAPFDLEEITIGGLHAGFKSGKYTVRSITEKYMQRIKEIDRSGPAINSVIQLNPDALKIADELDKELKEKGPRSNMHGIPVLIKDNIDTADNMETTAGSLALVGSKPEKDSFVVKQLRDAGALILGKTNLSEWANMRSTHSTSGWTMSFS